MNKLLYFGFLLLVFWMFSGCLAPLMPIGAKIHTIARPTMNNSSGQSPYLTTEGFGTGNVDLAATPHLSRLQDSVMK